MVGGDLTRADQVVIAVTVIGALHRGAGACGRARAPATCVALTGRQGWAAGGLAVLGRGFRSPRVLVEAYRRPEPPYDAGQVAAEAGATAMIDISDGLLADAGHIADRLRRRHRRPPRRASRSPSRCRRSAPPSAPTRSSSSWAAATTTPCSRPSPTGSVPEGWSVVGSVGEGSGVTVDGEEYDGPTGWTHF